MTESAPPPPSGWPAPTENSWLNPVATQIRGRTRWRRILITGGSGFIGTNLVQAYRGAGFEVLNLDIAPPRHPEHGPVWEKADLLDRSGLNAALRGYGPDIVLHLAARTDLDEAADASYEANVAGVTNLLAAVGEASSVRRVVVTSTQLVCRPGYTPRSDTDYAPHTAYGRSKVRTEQITRSWRASCPWLLVRPTSIWGPWFRVPYLDFFLAVSKNRYLNVRGTDPLRSFGFVGNAVSQIAALADADDQRVSGRTFYVADLEATRLRTWSEVVRREMGASDIKDVPRWLMRAAARAGDLLETAGLAKVPLTSFRLRNMLTDNVADLAPTKAIVGSDPYGLEQGVRITVAWMRDRQLI